MMCLSKVLAAVLCGLLMVAVGTASAPSADALPGLGRARIAQSPPDAQQEDQQTKQERKRERRERQQQGAPKDAATPPPADKPAAPKINTEFGDTVEIIADNQSKTGDLFVYEGYVNATL